MITHTYGNILIAINYVCQLIFRVGTKVKVCCVKKIVNSFFCKMAAVAEFNDPRQEILTRFWSRTDSRPICLTDLVFKCSDGPVEAHKALLKSSCDVLAQALQNAQAFHEDPVTVLVPEFSASTVRKFLELFYTGCVQVSADGDIDAITNFGVGHLGFRFNLTGDEKSEQSASVSRNLEGVGTFPTAASVSSNPEGSSIITNWLPCSIGNLIIF